MRGGGGSPALHGMERSGVEEGWGYPRARERSDFTLAPRGRRPACLRAPRAEGWRQRRHLVAALFDWTLRPEFSPALPVSKSLVSGTICRLSHHQGFSVSKLSLIIAA